LGKIGARHGGRSAAEVAVAWTLANPAVTAAIVGGRSPEQVDGFAGAMTLQLTMQDLSEIDRYRAEHP
jgi:aryl-alcohol dehydrogenase-like predicted oxidoreductase